MRPTLTLMVGFPACGKSTIAADMDAVVICPDDIRMEIFSTEFDSKVEGMVWFAAQTMARMLLKNGQNVVIDATNLTAYRRKGWIDIAQDYSANVHACFIPTLIEECKRRNTLRDRVVPDVVYDKMAESFEPMEENEGFDKIYEISV